MLNGDIFIRTQTVEHDDSIYILLFIYSLTLFPRELWAIQFHTLTLSLIDYLPSFRLPSKSISGLQFWIILGIYFILYSAGAILAMGRGGRETTLWHVQKKIFDKILVILVILWLQTYLTQWIERNIVQNTRGHVLWRGF